MKEELTTKMHSEFTVSEEIDRKNIVGSAIKFAMMGGGGEDELEYALSIYGVKREEYERWKVHWGNLGVKI